jgi:hypothetical protein
MNKHARPAATYDSDVHQWAVEQAAHLRAGRLESLDLEYIAEEIDSVGRSEKREIESRLEVLLMHLLKWRFQPEKRTRSWQRTISLQRLKLKEVIDENPSLHNWPDLKLAGSYEAAHIAAEKETGLAFEVFPETCPFSIAQIMDDAFPS